MIRCFTAALLVLALATPVAAAPYKVLVLPLDGNAPADTRKKLSASFQKMARVLDGTVEPGNTSLADTATAIGCDAAKLACVENVRATLGVDELVYGTADDDAGTITVVAKRYRKGKPLRELTVSQAAADPPSNIEPQLLPVFGNEPLPASGTSTDPTVPDPNTAITGPVQQPQAGVVEGGSSSNRERNIWIGVTAGGGLFVAIGLALWSQASNLQDDINDANTNSDGDFENLQELEDKASSRAWTGNIFVIAGLAVAGYGGYRLWKHKKSDVVVTPAPVEGGAAVFVRGGW